MSHRRLPRSAPVPFFARLRGFDIACPGCGEVYCIRTRKGNIRGRENRAQWSGWDIRTSTWKCPSCQAVFILGIVAWSPKQNGHRTPPDHVPSLEQSQALRQLRASFLEARRRNSGDPANQLRIGEPGDGVWRGLPDGVTLADVDEGRWEGPDGEEPERG